MRKLLASFILTLVFFFSVLFPAQSKSLSLIWPVEGKLGVKFGEKYQAEEGEKTHLGIDILAPEGREIKSPAEGEVSFAGQVAGRLAVTINIEGYKVSLSPLDEVSVLKGEKVEVGKVIGKLAAEGDYSSSEPHLHFSLRDSAGKYLDPLPFLTPSTEEEQPQEQPQPQLQEQPVSKEVEANPEFDGEMVGNPSLKQLPDQVGANQPQRGIQARDDSVLQPVLTWQRASRMLLAKESSILHHRRSKEKFGAANLKKEVKSFRLASRAGLKNISKFSLDSFNQHQPQGLAELTQLSTGIIQNPPVKSGDGKTNSNFDNLLLLSWSFLVLPLIYLLFCLAGKGNSNLWFNLAEA